MGFKRSWVQIPPARSSGARGRVSQSSRFCGEKNVAKFVTSGFVHRASIVCSQTSAYKICAHLSDILIPLSRGSKGKVWDTPICYLNWEFQQFFARQVACMGLKYRIGVLTNRCERFFRALAEFFRRRTEFAFSRDESDRDPLRLRC